MPTLKQFILPMILILFLLHPAAAKMYKWVDADGVMHFSDTPPAIEKVETLETVVSDTPKPASAAYPKGQTSGQAPGFSANERAAVKKETRNHQVDIYITSWCRYCKDAMAFLKANDIQFNAYNIEKDSRAKKQMQALGGTGGVPFARINGQIIRGYSPGAYRRALGL